MSSYRWFVSPKVDLAFIIFTPVYAALFLATLEWAHMQWPSKDQGAIAYVFFLIFTAIFDAPHIFQTLTRTHLDSTEYNRRGIWHWIFLGGALCITILCYWNKLDEEFLVFLSFYGTWHIIRQNIGFVRLYQHLNKTLSAGVDKLEVQIHYLGMAVFYCFQTDEIKDIFSNTQWFYIEPYLTLLRWVLLILLIVLSAYCLFMNRAIYQKYRQWNLPKMLLIGANIILLLGLISISVHPLILIAVSTIAHNIQYQTWVSVYNSRRTGQSTYALYAFLVCAISGGLFAIAPEFLAMYYNGFVLWHYFIDGKIWRLSHSPELQQHLRLDF